MNVLLLLGSGAAVGAATAGLLSALGIISRVNARFGVRKHIHIATAAICLGGLAYSTLYFGNLTINGGAWLSAIFFVGAGLFVGTLISALTDTVDVLPTIMTRLRLRSIIRVLILALASGKLIGTAYAFLGGSI